MQEDFKGLEKQLYGLTVELSVAISNTIDWRCDNPINPPNNPVERKANDRIVYGLFTDTDPDEFDRKMTAIVADFENKLKRHLSQK